MPILPLALLRGDGSLQFELLRLSLLHRASLFALRTPDGGELSREDWIRRVFSTQIAFLHRKEEYHYVPDPDLATAPGVFLIAGRLGRLVSVKANEPPEGALHETHQEIWRAALIFIDPTTHEYGQKVAMENDGAIGRPLALFSSLLDKINGSNEAPYEIQGSPITDPATFWDFEKAHKGAITSVTFEFIAPNMFPDKNDWDADMREMKERERARKVRLQLESSDGLELETERVRGAIEHISKGTGSVKARTKTRQKFDSTKKTKKVIAPEGIELVDVMHWLVDKAFGKEISDE